MTEQPKNDGGPAFPYPKQQIDSVEMEGHVEVIFGHPGMSLRDWLAGQALVGILSNKESLDACVRMSLSRKEPTVLTIGKFAYEHADAMLEARDADN